MRRGRQGGEWEVPLGQGLRAGTMSLGPGCWRLGCWRCGGVIDEGEVEVVGGQGSG